MGLIAGSVMRLNEPLRTNDYIQSPSATFYAIVQADGNFVVYRGSGPDRSFGALWDHGHVQTAGLYYAIVQPDANFVVYRGTGPADSHGPIWSSGVLHNDGRPYFATMQDDGNFVVYRGVDLGDQEQAVWSAGVTDPVVSFTDVQWLHYDLADAKVTSTAPAEVDRQTVENNTSETQTTQITLTHSVVNRRSWSSSTDINVRIDGSFSVGVPDVIDGKVEITATVDYASTNSGETTTTEDKSWTLPFQIPPYTTGVATALMSTSDIAIPYSMLGTIVYQSGVHAAGNWSGTYQGTSASDAHVIFTATGSDDARPSPRDFHLPIRVALTGIHPDRRGGSGPMIARWNGGLAPRAESGAAGSSRA